MSNTSDIYQISAVGGTTAALLSAAPPVSFLSGNMPAPLPTLGGSGHVAPNTAIIIGSGGSPSGWPFSDYNIMNDPEGNMAALPPLYLDGAGGQGGDPLAFGPLVDDNASAGFANAGAGMTGEDAIVLALGDPGYVAAATKLNASDLAGADNEGMQILAQDQSKIDWSKVTADQQPDVTKGFIELTKSTGVACTAAVTSTVGAIYGGARMVAAAPSNAYIKGGVAAFASVQVMVTAAVMIGKCAESASVNGPMTADENYALGLMFGGTYNAMKTYNSQMVGGGPNGLKPMVVGDSTSGGSVATVDATLGGKLNYLTSAYDAMAGKIDILHATHS